MLTITHEMHHPMNGEYEIRGVFLKMLDAFDKVWHEGLVFKLKRNWISGSLLNVLEDFIRNRKQRFVLNGHLIVKIFMQTFPRFYLGTTVVHNLYQWFCRKSIDNFKLFADEISLLSLVHDLNTSYKKVKWEETNPIILI